ncbi:MAG: HNH endonuclease [Proteobacteria bacterium]|nr:HNH endonuclease [Pseudomonadota bacterium]
MRFCFNCQKSEHIVDFEEEENPSFRGIFCVDCLIKVNRNKLHSKFISYCRCNGIKYKHLKKNKKAKKQEIQKKRVKLLPQETYKDDNGYLRFVSDDKLVHHVVMEKKLGRRIRFYGLDDPRSEVVHHIDKDKTNNSPSNIRLMNIVDHTRMHGHIWPRKGSPRNAGEGPNQRKPLKRRTKRTIHPSSL